MDLGEKWRKGRGVWAWNVGLVSAWIWFEGRIDGGSWGTRR
jgi:hypothetical protein